MSRETLPLALVFALVLGILYVGAYYYMVKPTLLPPPAGAASGTPWQPVYRAGTPFCRIIFRPIHTVDRRLRPHAFLPVYLCPSDPR